MNAEFVEKCRLVKYEIAEGFRDGDSIVEIGERNHARLFEIARGIAAEMNITEEEAALAILEMALTKHLDKLEGGK
jgi:hypothetical protein